MELEEFENQPEKGQKKKRSGCLIFLIVILSLVLVMLIAAELVFMYLQARNGMHSEMERKLNQAVK